jgi:hypothetical protein
MYRLARYTEGQHSSDFLSLLSPPSAVGGGKGTEEQTGN